jgi:predicted hydrocarbon binding protein
MNKRVFPFEREEDGAFIYWKLREKTRKRHGNRMIMFGAGTFVEIQKEAESILGEEASAVFYEAGIRAGKEAGESILTEFDERGKDLLKIVDGLWDSTGTGWFKLIDSNYDFEINKAYLVVDQSFIALTYGPVGKKVCHFISGFMAGSLETIYGVPMIGTEEKCWSNKDKYCEFRFEPV